MMDVWWLLNPVAGVLLALYNAPRVVQLTKLLFVLSLIAAPLLVRRARRGEARLSTRLGWPGVALLMTSWVFFAWTSFVLFVDMLKLGSHLYDGGLQFAKFTVDETAVICLLALVTNAWTALCAAFGVRATTRPEQAAALRHGLIVSMSLSAVAFCQFVLFDTLGALLTEPTVTRGAEAVLPLVRRLEWAFGATAASFVVAVAAAWRGGRRGLWHFGLWQLGVVAVTVLSFGAWVFGYLLTHTVWNTQRVALGLPYTLPQRPLGAPSRTEQYGSDVCARDGSRWRCSWAEEAIEKTEPPNSTLAVPQDTALSELQRSERGTSDTEILNLNHVSLLVCAGSPRASTRGLERWFTPDLAACSVLSLRSEGPYSQPEPSTVVIEAARDWTVQRLVDEVTQTLPPEQREVWVRWAREPG